MNTTMAPMDESRQNSLKGLRRRDDLLDELPIRRRDNNKAGRDGSGSSNSNGNPSGNSNGNGNPSGNSNGNGNPSGNSNGNGDSSGKGSGNGNDNPSKDDSRQKTTNSPLPNINTPTPSPPESLTLSPTTIVVVSTTTAPATAALTTSISLEPTTTLPTLVSSFFPTTTSFSTDAAFTIPTSADTSSQPRKGVNTDGDPSPSSTSSGTTKTRHQSTITTDVMAQTALGSAATSLAVPNASSGSDHHGKNGPVLSRVAEQVLIAAGAIGAFIMICAGIYFLTRVMKIDLLRKFRNRKFSRRGARGWYGWRQQETDYTLDPPPIYPGETFRADEKAIPPQRQLDAFFTPMARPPLATPAGAATLSNVNAQRQETIRAGLLENSAPFGVSPTGQTTDLSARANSYNVSPQNINLSREPGTQVSQASQYSQDSALVQQQSSLSRLPGSQVSALSRPNSNYNNTGTQNTFLTMQTSDAYDPDQREVNHLSYLSSLSSGFGDGLIVPESTVNGGQPGQRQTRKFSWVSSVRDRDTVYTQASVESTPRFRTVNSWVAQQSSRLEKQPQTSIEIPAMPAIPSSLQAGPDHQRKPSEDPAFRAHPGDEVPISGGSRVPSAILDRKIGRFR